MRNWKVSNYSELNGSVKLTVCRGGFYQEFIACFQLFRTQWLGKAELSWCRRWPIGGCFQLFRTQWLGKVLTLFVPAIVISVVSNYSELNGSVKEAMLPESTVFVKFEFPTIPNSMAR